MRRRLVVLAAIGGTIGCGLAAPAAQAVTASIGIAPGERDGYVRVEAAPGEQNDMRIVALGEPSTRVVTIVDREATFTPATGGVPCRIVTPHKARCAIRDMFPTEDRFDPANPLTPPHGLVWTQVDLEGGGPDRLVIPPRSSPASYMVDSGGNSRFRFTGPSNVALSMTEGDRANYLAGANGFINIGGANATLRTINGAIDSIWCEPGTNPKLRAEPTDAVRGDCGDNVLPPRLPGPGI
jgi:hypothetical protein